VLLSDATSGGKRKTTLIEKSKIHAVYICGISTKDKNNVRKGCLNKKCHCKALFPHEVVNHTMVDSLTGALL
jgi:hypothetical protein